MRGGDLILMARRRADLTQRELASHVGCRQATIARWERGDRQPSFEDVEYVVSACGLELDAHLLAQDRSWWPQIAQQLARTPAERVRHLTQTGASVDLVAVLDAVVGSVGPLIVIGEVAGAIHGWPLVLEGGAVQVCLRPSDAEVAVEQLSATRVDSNTYELPAGGRIAIDHEPAGTSGYGDLARGAEFVSIEDGAVQVAGLLDLLRIADATPGPGGRRHTLAYRALLDVERAQSKPRPDDERPDVERIESWLGEQTPVA